jgi:hypothetical protein
MALEALITDGIAHAGAGVALSLLDFITYKLTNPKARRLEQKKECLRAIEALLDTEKSQEKTAEEEEEKVPTVDEGSEEASTADEEGEETSTDSEDSEKVSTTSEESEEDSTEEQPSDTLKEDPPPAPIEGGLPQEGDSPTDLQKDSMEYAEQVTMVRDYLRTSGLVKLQLPVLDRMKDGLRNLVLKPRISRKDQYLVKRAKTWSCLWGRGTV